PRRGAPLRKRGLLRRDDVQLERRDDVLAQTYRGLVATGRLHRGGEFDGLLVDGTEPGGLDGGCDIRGLDRAEQTTLTAGLDGQLDGRFFELGLKGLRVLEGGELTSGTGRLDLLDLLLAATAPRHGEALRDEVVARVAVLDLDDVSGRTESGHFGGEDELRHSVAS